MATLAVERVRRRLGRVGVWLAPPTLRVVDAEAERAAARRIEALGFGSLWTGESLDGKEIFSHLGVLLAATDRLVVGAGIANLWARLPRVMQGGAATLADAYPGRSALGVGVGHAYAVEAIGQSYARPVARMREYLAEMDAVASEPPVPSEPFVRLVGALRPRMLEVAAELADGTHPFLVPVEHTARARAVVGPDRLVIPHQAVILDTDPAAARAAAQRSFGLGLANHAENLRSLGYFDDDLADGVSDRLIDALVAWGDADTIATRVREHLDAGADHVLVHPLAADLLPAEPWHLDAAVDLLEKLAPTLTAGR